MPCTTSYCIVYVSRRQGNYEVVLFTAFVLLHGFNKGATITDFGPCQHSV